MSAYVPIFASEVNAARLLDMKTAEFRALVESGHLPQGRVIAPGLVRWPVDDLRTIARGEAIEGLGEVRW